jgi:hypothetical protein
VAAPGIGHANDIEQRLNGAVLTVSTVEPEKNHVRLFGRRNVLHEFRKRLPRHAAKVVLRRRSSLHTAGENLLLVVSRQRTHRRVDGANLITALAQRGGDPHA